MNLALIGGKRRPVPILLFTISLYSKANRNPDFLTEQVRQALARNICRQNLSDTGELLAITIAPDVETTIAKGVAPDGQNLTLEPDFVKRLMDSINSELENKLRVAQDSNEGLKNDFDKCLENEGKNRQVCADKIRELQQSLSEMTIQKNSLESEKDRIEDELGHQIETLKQELAVKKQEADRAKGILDSFNSSWKLISSFSSTALASSFSSFLVSSTITVFKGTLVLEFFLSFEFLIPLGMALLDFGLRTSFGLFTIFLTF